MSKMSQSDKKLLVSGCGITFSGQQAKTWVNILSLAGADIIDVSGPAVSNQWILNRAFLHMAGDSTIGQTVIQLTALNKLDVEINSERIATLVDPDPIRNFTVDDVWPSSASTEHESKRLWQQWLSSPGLERQDIMCKLLMLKHWCDTHGIDLVVVQGYDLFWNDDQRAQLSAVITDIDRNIMDDYRATEWYDRSQTIDVPVLGFQFELAAKLCQVTRPDLVDKIQKFRQDFDQRR